MRFSISILTLAILSVTSVLAKPSATGNEETGQVANGASVPVVKTVLDKVIPGAQSEEVTSNNAADNGPAPGKQAPQQAPQDKEQPKTQQQTTPQQQTTGEEEGIPAEAAP
ncbi:hypothetical protein BDA99DRAFT_564787 [Phascolomyces articulosus]|uniref:Uncharacterized protein n=1 Tax=Phascolomyces articulosus TaxID=60185 RepID=A0AAD5P962_9FUNG|nr:hypothetical protein BDA99DRAFT_564787 [Phascolomyces articulosus]